MTKGNAVESQTADDSHCAAHTNNAGDLNNQHAPSPARAKSSGPRRKLLRYTMIGVASLSCALLTVVGIYIVRLAPTVPDVARLVDVRLAQPSVILAADGTELANFRRKQREWVALDQISPSVVSALLATEDRRFYVHRGVDVGRTLAAVFHTANGDTQGGSTITQQLARNLFQEEIGSSRSVSRKLKEILTAIQIERTYSKQQILETYLNTVPFLYNAFGIEMAARTYFDKSAAQLDVLEAATLVGMLKGTYYYNPVLHPQRAQTRRNVVLAQLVAQQQLSKAEFQSLRQRPLNVNFKRQIDRSAPSSHFAQHVRKWLIAWAAKNNIDLDTAGLTVHTTLDRRLQEAAMNAVQSQSKLLQDVADVEWGKRYDGVLSHSTSAYSRMRRQVEPFSYFWSSRPDLAEAFIRESAEFRHARKAGETDAAALGRLRQDPGFMAQLRADKTRLEAGFVAIEPATGEVKAWVGSRDFKRDQFDHVAQAERQPGSTFKPIVYGAALEQGFRPTRAYLDAPVEIQAPDGDLWQPTDMRAPSLQPMSLRDGLIYSKNTITARVMRDVGLPDIVKLARAAGVNQSKLHAVPSLSLGTSPVTLLEMVSAYSTIARAGEYRAPVFIKRIVDRDGNLLAELGKKSRRAMSEDTAIELIDMLRSAVTRGTGQDLATRFGITGDVAGKTGTTQNNTDGWFILMHPDLVAGSWVGFNDTRVTMRTDHWGQGGHNALLVVGDFFRDVLKDKLIDPKEKFPRPQRGQMMAALEPSSITWQDQTRASSEQDESTKPAEIIVRRLENGTIFIGDARGAADMDPSTRSTNKTPEEMAKIMLSLGRDPVTGAVIGSGERMTGASGARQQDGNPDMTPTRRDGRSTAAPPSLR